MDEPEIKKSIRCVINQLNGLILTASSHGVEVELRSVDVTKICDGTTINHHEAIFKKII